MHDKIEQDKIKNPEIQSNWRELKMNGEKNPKAKLTEEEVKEIKRLRREKNLSQSELAKIFGVTGCNISYILSGKTWGHVR